MTWPLKHNWGRASLDPVFMSAHRPCSQGHSWGVGLGVCVPPKKNHAVKQMDKGKLVPPHEKAKPPQCPQWTNLSYATGHLLYSLISIIEISDRTKMFLLQMFHLQCPWSCSRKHVCMISGPCGASISACVKLVTLHWIAKRVWRTLIQTQSFSVWKPSQFFFFITAASRWLIYLTVYPTSLTWCNWEINFVAKQAGLVEALLSHYFF